MKQQGENFPVPNFCPPPKKKEVNFRLPFNQLRLFKAHDIVSNFSVLPPPLCHVFTCYGGPRPLRLMTFSHALDLTLTPSRT